MEVFLVQFWRLQITTCPPRLPPKITWKPLQSGKSADFQLQICNPAQARIAANVLITSWWASSSASPRPVGSTNILMKPRHTPLIQLLEYTIPPLLSSWQKNPAPLEPAYHHLRSGYFQTVSVALVKKIFIAIIYTVVAVILTYITSPNVNKYNC